MREVIPIYPTSAEYANTFCPVSILSVYCTARQMLYLVADSDLLFPKMSSCFKHGTERQMLTIAIPVKCLPMDCYLKKFKFHIDSQELRRIQANYSNRQLY